MINLRRLPLTREMSIAVLLYLYIPIVVLVFYSFNANRTATVWIEFSLHWYERILIDQSIRVATWNSLVIATFAAVGSTIIALLAALATAKPFRGFAIVEAILNTPLILPEIVVAVATLLLFMTIGFDLGLGVMTAAHVAFCIPFAYLPIRARLTDMSPSLTEASQDLYANRYRTFRFITLPLLWPGILAGFTLAFVASLDDFITSFFLSGPGTTTLPVYIFSAIRAGVTPEINAISTLMLAISVTLVVLSYIIGKLRR